MPSVTTCKVICVYAGERRSTHASPTTPEAVVQTLKESIQAERMYDACLGSDLRMDIIIIFNSNYTEETWSTGQQKMERQSAFVFDKFRHLNNTHNASGGRIYIETRKNTGGSFGAFNHAYQKYRWKYDYFMFQEDDIIMLAGGYMTQAVSVLQKDAEVGFVAFSPIAQAPIPHCGGGFGVSSTKILDRAAALGSGQLPVAASNNYGDLENAEVRFTGVFQQLNLKIANNPYSNPLAKNWQQHYGQRQYDYFAIDNRPTIYQVGINL